MMEPSCFALTQRALIRSRSMSSRTMADDGGSVWVQCSVATLSGFKGKAQRSVTASTVFYDCSHPGSVGGQGSGSSWVFSDLWLWKSMGTDARGTVFIRRSYVYEDLRFL